MGKLIVGRNVKAVHIMAMYVRDVLTNKEQFLIIVLTFCEFFLFPMMVYSKTTRFKSYNKISSEIL